MARLTPATDRHRGWGTRRRRGFTLAEGLMASSVLALAVAGLVTPMLASYHQTEVYEETQVATSLANQLIEEIAVKPMADPITGSMSLGTDGGESTRTTFNDIGDYANWSETTQSLARLSGGVVAGAPFRRTVRVEYRDDPLTTSATPTDVMLVTVTVTGPSGTQVALSRLLTRVPRYR